MKFELTHDNATDTLVLRLEMPTQELAAMFTNCDDAQVQIALLTLAAGGMQPHLYLHAAGVAMKEAQRVGKTIDLNAEPATVAPTSGVVQ
jgi:hypothetical protein